MLGPTIFTTEFTLLFCLLAGTMHAGQISESGLISAAKSNPPAARTTAATPFVWLLEFWWIMNQSATFKMPVYKVILEPLWCQCSAPSWPLASYTCPHSEEPYNNPSSHIYVCISAQNQLRVTKQSCKSLAAFTIDFHKIKVIILKFCCTNVICRCFHSTGSSI